MATAGTKHIPHSLTGLFSDCVNTREENALSSGSEAPDDDKNLGRTGILFFLFFSVVSGNYNIILSYKYLYWTLALFHWAGNFSFRWQFVAHWIPGKHCQRIGPIWSFIWSDCLRFKQRISEIKGRTNPKPNIEFLLRKVVQVKRRHHGPPISRARSKPRIRGAGSSSDERDTENERYFPQVGWKLLNKKWVQLSKWS